MKTLLLIGGGHTHLYILKKLQSNPLAGVRVILVSPSPYQYYSGMLSGYIEGLYSLDEIRIDLHRLSDSAGVSFLKDQAVRIDPANRILYLEQGGECKYDAVSFDIGSETAQTSIPGVADHAVIVKPLARFVENVKKLENEQRIIVVGGGPSGIELSFAIKARQQRKGMGSQILLVSAGELMNNRGQSVSKKISDLAVKKGIRLHLNDKVTSVSPDRIGLESDSELEYDQLFWMTGPQAPSLFRKSGLQTRDDGYLVVQPTLQSMKYPNLFAAGDCISINGYPKLPKAGVYAVKEAPILWNNLQAYFSGAPMKTYSPQKRYLSLISTGSKEAFLLYGRIGLHGKWCWKLKQRIDVSFMENYR